MHHSYYPPPPSSIFSFRSFFILPFFSFKILGPDVSDVDYVAFTSDQDAYAYSGQVKSSLEKSEVVKNKREN